MSTIPTGLRGDLMRKRILDKASLTEPGALYASSIREETYFPGTTGYQITTIAPGNSGEVLINLGGLRYGQAWGESFEDNAITLNKIGAGGVAQDTNKKKVLRFSQENDSKIAIDFVDATSTLPTPTFTNDAIKFAGSNFYGPILYKSSRWDPSSDKKYYVVDYVYGRYPPGSQPKARYVASTILNDIGEQRGTVNFTRTGTYKSGTTSFSSGDRVFFGDMVTANITSDSTYQIRAKFKDDTMTIINPNSGLASISHEVTTDDIDLNEPITFARYYGYPIWINPQYSDQLEVQRRSSPLAEAPTGDINRGSYVYLQDKLSIFAKSSPVSKALLTYYEGNAGSQVNVPLNYCQSTMQAVTITNQNQTRYILLTINNALPRDDSTLLINPASYHIDTISYGGLWSIITIYVKNITSGGYVYISSCAVSSNSGGMEGFWVSGNRHVRASMTNKIVFRVNKQLLSSDYIYLRCADTDDSNATPQPTYYIDKNNIPPEN